MKGLDGDFSVKQWNDLVKKYDGKCAMCGKVKKLTYDHVVPYSSGRNGLRLTILTIGLMILRIFNHYVSWCNKSKGAK